MSTLYLVATPIGNLSDLSPRAREVLSTVDFIAAEDTRVTQKLLNACELPKKPMISYYEHNRRARGEAVLEKLLAGETCALVTDAGTPAVSDPGEDLVALCAEHDVPVIPIPGCCAAVCALAASGLPTGRWCFEGFLSVNKKARREHLDTLQGEKRTMIFYEAPHKLCATLRDLRDAFGGDRRLSLSRELTKLHEQTLRMTLDEAIAYFDANAPRGEFVLILEGAPDEPETEQDEAERLASAAEAVRRRMEQGQTQKDAVDVSGSRCGSNVRVRGTAHAVRTAQHRRPRSPVVCRLQGNPPACGGRCCRSAAPLCGLPPSARQPAPAADFPDPADG